MSSGALENEVEDRYDESESEGPSDAGTEAGIPAGEADPQQKKKKKRKKKKKKGISVEHQAPSAQPSAATKHEADARFFAALQQLQRSAPECSWTRLDNCNIYDAKSRKVAEALKQNRELTSLDLSSNHIGDAGAQALAEALQQGAAPELVFLDLRENPFGSNAIAKLEQLQGQRRSLRVEVGAFPSIADIGVRASIHEDSDPDPDGREMLEVKSTLGPATTSAPQRNGFLERFFQVGNGSPGPDVTEPAVEREEDPEQMASELWQEVEELVGGAGGANVHELSNKLRQCLAGVRREMETCSVPLLSNTKLVELRPYTKNAVLKIAVMGKVLELPAPSSHVTPSSKLAEPGAGSHRACVAQIVERLSYGRTAAINTHLVKASMLPRLFSLCFDFPNNNVVQSACCSTLRWALESGLHLLWKPLLSPGMGLKSKPRRHLVAELISALEAAHTATAISHRKCIAGFALHVASQLRKISRTDSLLQRALEEGGAWASFAAEGGTLERLLVEQEGDLCGPRPDRPKLQIPPDSSQELQTETPNLISGDDLVKLLTQSVKGIHICDSTNFDDSDDDSDEEPPTEDQGVDELQRLIDAPIGSSVD